MHRRDTNQDNEPIRPASLVLYLTKAKKNQRDVFTCFDVIYRTQSIGTGLQREYRNKERKVSPEINFWLNKKIFLSFVFMASFSTRAANPTNFKTPLFQRSYLFLPLAVDKPCCCKGIPAPHNTEPCEQICPQHRVFHAWVRTLCPKSQDTSIGQPHAAWDLISVISHNVPFLSSYILQSNNCKLLQQTQNRKRFPPRQLLIWELQERNKTSPYFTET